MLAAFTTMDAASNTVSEIIAQGMVPSALEMMDRNTIDAVEPFYQPGYPVDAQAVLIVEVDGLKESVEEQAEAIIEICNNNGAMEIREANDEEREPSYGKLEKGQSVHTDQSLRPIISSMVLYLAQSYAKSYDRLIKLQPNFKLRSQMYSTQAMETFTQRYYSTSEIQKRSNKPYSRDPEFSKLVSPQVGPCRESTV
ncbi:MAG: hypothetical protein CM1200mP39_26600 [Dehalococcoidia bacterium]|nr:MAG: hypothetical protein CM1200mP39_26600 [Dehalococcoidia bacterium]